MGEPRLEISFTPKLKLSIADNEDVASVFKKFEWKSFLNGGYIIKASVTDAWWSVLSDIIGDYLKKARKDPTPVKWSIEWPGVGKTEERTAFLTDLHIPNGKQEVGDLEFIAIDPPSFFLNAGNCDGSVFEGNVSEVIEKVVKKYAPDINLEIGTTKDHNKNKFWMMRQDPKTFIMSLLDWSSSVNSKKTNWIVASSDDNLIIKEQAQFNGKDFGILNVNTNSPNINDVISFEFLSNNFLTTIQTKLITQGISSVSEQYLDKISDKEEKQVFVKDETTESKKNTEIRQDRGFKKPKDSLNFDDGLSSSGATSIMAIPEFSGQELGVKYRDYIDGRARNQFLRMLTLLNRLKVRVPGHSKLDDSTKLGVSTITLNWFDADKKNFFLSGKWLIYGWHHVVKPGDWYTDIYLTRLDFDAAADKV